VALGSVAGAWLRCAWSTIRADVSPSALGTFGVDVETPPSPRLAGTPWCRTCVVRAACESCAADRTVSGSLSTFSTFDGGSSAEPAPGATGRCGACWQRLGARRRPGRLRGCFWVACAYAYGNWGWWRRCCARRDAVALALGCRSGLLADGATGVAGSQTCYPIAGWIVPVGVLPGPIPGRILLLLGGIGFCGSLHHFSSWIAGSGAPHGRVNPRGQALLNLSLGCWAWPPTTAAGPVRPALVCGQAARAARDRSAELGRCGFNGALKGPSTVRHGPPRTSRNSLHVSGRLYLGEQVGRGAVLVTFGVNLVEQA